MISKYLYLDFHNINRACVTFNYSHSSLTYFPKKYTRPQYGYWDIGIPVISNTQVAQLRDNIKNLGDSYHAQRNTTMIQNS
jgi:hypothetical protein